MKIIEPTEKDIRQLHDMCAGWAAFSRFLSCIETEADRQAYAETCRKIKAREERAAKAEGQEGHAGGGKGPCRNGQWIRRGPDA